MSSPFRPLPPEEPAGALPMLGGDPGGFDAPGFLDEALPELPDVMEVEPDLTTDGEMSPGARGLRALRDELDATIPANAEEIDERDDIDDPDFEVLGREEDEALLAGVDEEGEDAAQSKVIRDAILRATYGSDFPLLMDSPTDADWVSWAEGLWQRHQSGVERRLHAVKRNRLFRDGVQWISSQGTGPWREPPKPRDAARVVYNMIAPALDQRVQIVAEQRPGFRARPASQDPEDLKKADAVQAALEYQFDQQGRAEVVKELEYWCGTDGVAFEELFWNPDIGPWHEFMPDGTTAKKAPGSPGAEPLGDVDSRVLRIEHVRVSANATGTRKPHYVVIKEPVPLAEAAALYGRDIFADGEAAEQSNSDDAMEDTAQTKLGALLANPDELHRDQETVDKITVYCEPSEYLPKGLQVIVCGRKLCLQQGLMFGCIPVVRWTDGSTDPSYFCKAVVEQWLESQMRVNALLSKWVEAIRLGAGQRLLAKTNAIESETLLGGTVSVIGVKAASGSIGDAVQPLTGVRLNEDAVKLFEFEKKAFEDMSGWNDTTRGSYSADLSGRAILAIREQVERAFMPLVTAAARAQTDWAKVTLAIMGWGYDIPRTVQTVGESRPDLARALTRDDFDGTVDVFIDPETLMPMPRSLRLFLLNDLYAKGAMPVDEYRRRLPYAFVKNLGTADEDHEARARRVAEAIRAGNPSPPILWMDNEAIHQDVLERELLLPDDVPPEVSSVAFERWMQLAQQSDLKKQMAMMGMSAPGGMMSPAGPAPAQLPPGAGPGGPGASPERPPQGEKLAPTEQPFQGMSPGIAATTGTSGLGGEPDASSLATAFDRIQPF